MRKKPEPKPLFIERMKKLIPDKEDFQKYLDIIKEEPLNSIRCNTIKNSPEKLKKNLEKNYGWKISIPFSEYPEVMVVTSELSPGELGRSMEHLLGYYYIQEISSMLPVFAMKPKPNEIILDLCAAPGSKTTQIASEMKNTGLIIANEKSLGRIKILASNLERCGVSNTMITRDDGIRLIQKLEKMSPKITFDKILVDAPCSGEGTLRSSSKSALMWNINSVKSLSKLQKNLVETAFKILKINGELIYSTCTHSPEENEEVVNYILEKFGGKVKIEKICLNMPKELNCRPGITAWECSIFSDKVKDSCRIYPQDNDTEGFFLSKFIKIKD